MLRDHDLGIFAQGVFDHLQFLERLDIADEIRFVGFVRDYVFFYVNRWRGCETSSGLFPQVFSGLSAGQ